MGEAPAVEEQQGNAVAGYAIQRRPTANRGALPDQMAGRSIPFAHHREHKFTQRERFLACAWRQMS
jgi:hypothetical protein